MGSEPVTWVGRSVSRKEGPAKVTGHARYIDDITLPGMLHGVTVRSPVPRGKIRKIIFEDGIPWTEFIVVTAKDIPGKNGVALIVEDQPYLADGDVNHAEEPIVLLAHADRYLLEEARQKVRIEIDPLPAVLSMEDATAVIKSYTVNKGDVDAVWSSAHTIIEGEYATGAQEQLYIEPQGVIATAHPKDGVTVWGSLQCPYYVHKALMALTGLPADKVRVAQVETGGGFGGKEEYPSIIAGHAVLLALKSGKPVKMIYDRAEDMAATTKRHPSRTKIKTALDAQGKLLATEIAFELDGGAYATLSPVVLSRGTIHSAGPYFHPSIRIASRAVVTNTPPHGAFRGFGAPQSTFAMECHMDRIARAVQLAPEELRRRNLLRDGQTTATGQILRDGVDLVHIMDRALERSGYHAKCKAFAAQNAKGPVKKGIGFATFMHGAGFTGSGEAYLKSKVTVEVTPAGGVRVLAANTEIGQGKNTVFAQIAADALRLDVHDIDVVTPDTAVVPDSGPTVASRTTMVVGNLIALAAQEIRDMLIQSGLLGEAYSSAAFRAGAAAYVQKFGSLRATQQYAAPAGVVWDDKLYRGDAYGTYAWACYVAEVSVDMCSFEMRVDDFVAVQEVGRVVNPVLAAGQIEGGVVQGIGYALYEKVLWREGRMANNQMTNYIIPTSMDVPTIQVVFEEVPYAHGPGGAKGIGELPLDGAAPAVINAVARAIGRDVSHIPLLPEDLMQLVETPHG